jgi:hypothetical protein
MPRIDGIPFSEDVPVPEWFSIMKSCPNVRLVFVDEWVNERARQQSGFLGRDFCHSQQASVRVIDYLIVMPSPLSSGDAMEVNETEYPKIVGPAYFSQRCESHKGLCHGGSFCALMDDAIGWMGFCVSGEARPWGGFTVQVNTSLKKAVRVGSTLRLEAWVDRKEGSRKYWIKARLSDPLTGDLHCDGDGLFLMKV